MFLGNLRSAGGASGNSAFAGAAGTVYKYESRRGPQYRELKYNPSGNFSGFKPQHSKVKVDNEKNNVNTPTVIMENKTVFYEFDEMEVGGHSTVTFYHPTGAKNVSVVAHEITGDKTGIIRLTKRQRLVVNFVESTHTYMDAPCGFFVDEYAEIVFPTDVILRGETTVLRGRMTGIENLVLERNGTVTFGGHAHTAKLPNQTNWHVEDHFEPFTAGLIEIGSIIVNNQGVLTIDVATESAAIQSADTSVKKGKRHIMLSIRAMAKSRVDLFLNVITI